MWKEIIIVLFSAMVILAKDCKPLGQSCWAANECCSGCAIAVGRIGQCTDAQDCVNPVDPCRVTICDVMDWCNNWYDKNGKLHAQCLPLDYHYEDYPWYKPRP